MAFVAPGSALEKIDGQTLVSHNAVVLKCVLNLHVRKNHDLFLGPAMTLGPGLNTSFA